MARTLSGFPIVLVLAAIAVACPAAEVQTALTLKSVTVTLPDSDRVFPAGPGADLANANCVACHSVGMVLNQPGLPRATWEAEVNKMRTVYKAPVEQSDVAGLADYLTSIKGPKQP